MHQRRSLIANIARVTAGGERVGCMRGWTAKAIEPIYPSETPGIDHRTWMATHILAALISDGAAHDPDVAAERALRFTDAMLMALNPPRTRRKGIHPVPAKVG
jgi:hypothetical protein